MIVKDARKEKCYWWGNGLTWTLYYDSKSCTQGNKDGGVCVLGELRSMPIVCELVVLPETCLAAVRLCESSQ